MSVSSPASCATCELEISWPPIERGRDRFCCDGCAAGGPCICTYDDVTDSEIIMSVNLPSTTRIATPAGRIPMTAAAFRELEAEIGQLTASLLDARAAALEEKNGSDEEAPVVRVSGELHVLTQRRDALRAALGAAVVADDDGAVVVGSRVTVRDADGDADSYVLVPPGTGDPRAGRISPDSPLGAALLGRRAGEDIDVEAPAGVWRATIVAVE
jgi:transcription elongation factor GreA